MLVNWFNHMALISGMGLILSKCWRVFTIYKLSKKLRKAKITDPYLLLWVGIMLAVVAVYMTIWTVLDPLLPQEYDDPNDPELMYLICKNNSPVWFILLYIAEGSFIVIAAFLSYVTRKIELLLFNESIPIGLSAYSLLFSGAVLLPISFFIVDGQENARFGLYSIAILLNCTVILAVTFIPKLKLSLEDPNEIKLKKKGTSINVYKTRANQSGSTKETKTSKSNKESFLDDDLDE